MDLLTPENLVALLTLTLLEVVLGIDNIIFISILAGKLPQEQQARARNTGLLLALVTRVLLLLGISWLMSLTAELFRVFNHPVTGKDMILILGGLFLLFKSTHEIHGKLEGEEGHGRTLKAATMSSVIIQILLLDIVFSLDSVITAVGMVQNIPIMIAAIVIAMAVMLFAAGSISRFVNRHPTVNMLALAFLILIGVVLIADGIGHHIPKGYIYFAMAFSVGVEMLNLRLRKKAEPVHLHRPQL